MMAHVEERVHQEQVRIVYRLLPVGAVATIVNSALVAFLHRNLVPGPILFTWLASLQVLSLVRLMLMYVFFRRSKGIVSSSFWGSTLTVGMALSGLLWGSAAFFSLFHDSDPHRILVAFVLGGMSAGAAASYFALRAAYFAYVLPALAPQALVFFYNGGDPICLSMAAMIVLFAVLISASARTGNKLSTESLRLGFEREKLIGRLSDEKRETYAANDRLRAEIALRERTEQELRTARAELERKVFERTDDLGRANRDLMKEVSVRIETERALRRSEELYRSMVETAQEGIWVINDDHRVSYANERMASMLGYSAREIQGSDLCEFVVAEEQIRHGSERRRRGVRQKRLRKRDGSEIWVLESESRLPLPDSDDGLLLGMVTDITARHEREDLIIDLNNRLVDKNRELSAFTHSVSHDLRSPLGVIVAFSDLLQEQFGSVMGDEGRTYLRQLRSSVDKMTALIDDLLGLSKATESEMERKPVDLSGIAEEIAQELTTRSPDVHCEFSIEKGVVAECDQGLVRIALANLLENACKFSGRSEHPRVEFGSEVLDGRPVYHVSDNGIGFEMEHRDRIFAPFERLSSARSFPGTGIGLATVRRIIQRHGGAIWAESQPGKGATFYFTLSKPRSGEPGGGADALPR